MENTPAKELTAKAAFPHVWFAWLSAALAVVLGLVIVLEREFEAADEGYAVYNAWAAHGPAPEGTVMSRAWLKNDGYILGLPYLLSDNIRILDLRYFSLALWLLVHGFWFSRIVRFTGNRWTWALILLPVCLYEFQLPLVNYQTLPVLSGLLAASFLIARSPAHDDEGSQALGALYGCSVLVMAIAYTANVASTAVLLTATMLLVRQRRFRRGLTWGVIVGLLLWGAALPFERLFTSSAAEKVSDLDSFGGITGVVQAHAPRALILAAYVGVTLLAGVALSRLFARLERSGVRERVLRRVCIGGAMLFITVFILNWVFALRTPMTLVSYLSLAILAFVPEGYRTWRQCGRDGRLYILLVAHVILPVMVNGTFGIMLYPYYVGFTGPALLALVMASAMSAVEAQPSTRPWSATWPRPAWLTVLVLGVAFSLDYSHGDFSVIDPTQRWAGDGLLNGIPLSEESTGEYEEFIELYDRMGIEDAHVMIPDFVPILYCIWNKPCTINYAWLIPDTPFNRQRMANPENRPLVLVFRRAEQEKYGRNEIADWLTHLGIPEAEIPAADVRTVRSGDFTVVKLP